MAEYRCRYQAGPPGHCDTTRKAAVEDKVMVNKSLFLFISLALCTPCHGQDFFSERQEMVRVIRETARYTSAYTGQQAIDDTVLDAVARVPRHEFVPEALRRSAYADRPLPIGNGQTISQPFIVALMSDLADVGAESVVLEVGTGSGYQAAVLAELCKQVYSIEIVEELGMRAASTLQRLDYRNVTVRIGDGYRGWPVYAPFDAIVVTAAPESVPLALLKQLKPGGRLVIPVGEQGSVQSLQVWEKDMQGEFSTTDILSVSFVPMIKGQ